MKLAELQLAPGVTIQRGPNRQPRHAAHVGADGCTAIEVIAHGILVSYEDGERHLLTTLGCGRLVEDVKDGRKASARNDAA